MNNEKLVLIWLKQGILQTNFLHSVLLLLLTIVMCGSNIKQKKMADSEAVATREVQNTDLPHKNAFQKEGNSLKKWAKARRTYTK